MSSMLAGLCNLCDDFGHSNFESLQCLLDDLKEEGVLTTTYPGLVSDTRDFLMKIKKQIFNELQRHSPCAELCIDYALGQCSKEHTMKSTDLDKFHDIVQQVKDAVANVIDEERKVSFSKTLDEIVDNHKEYLAHLVRTKHQGHYYRFVLENLDVGELVVIIDYKMKVELGLRTRENQREWYGKRGISLHGFLCIAQVAEGQCETEVIDLWSEDTKQDSYFTQSALDIGFEDTYPGFSVYLFSDNGPHYHNSGVLFYLAEVNRVFNLKIKEYNNFEAGEGKSQLDSHFAHISHKIVRWVRLGNDLESGEQVSELIKTMKNVSCKKLLIDRSKSKTVGTLDKISLFGNFSFPTEGEFADGLQMRPLAGIGNATSKTKAQIARLSKRQSPIAGSTGADTLEQARAPEPTECPTIFPDQSREGYAVRFIQHSPEQMQAVPSFQQVEEDQYLQQRLQTGFALKHGPGKRTVFSQAQKDIMIEFYLRQATNSIRAEPKDVIKAMQDAGLEPLTVTQIRSWWSTYHRKNKNATHPTRPTVPSSRTPPERTPAPVPSGAGASSEHSSSAPSTAPSTADPCTSSSVPPAPTASESGQMTSHGPTIRQSVLHGTISQLSNEIIEWLLPKELSQSTINGRNGSNACAFICLYFGQVASQGTLPPRQGLALDVIWKDTLEEAILRGNDLHDVVFDQEGINVNVEDAVDIAGEDCGVPKLGKQTDLFGKNPKQLMTELVNELSSKMQRSYNLFFCATRSMFLMVDGCGYTYFVDSHSHINGGGLIASAPPGSGEAFVDWLEKMMVFNWSCPLTVASVHEIVYSHTAT